MGWAERSAWLLPCTALTEGSTSPVPQQLLCPAEVKSGLSFSNLKLFFLVFALPGPTKSSWLLLLLRSLLLTPTSRFQKHSDCQGGSMVNTQLALYKLLRVTAVHSLLGPSVSWLLQAAALAASAPAG